MEAPDLIEASESGDYRAQMEALLGLLAQAVTANPKKAALAKEYRETAQALEELKRDTVGDDPISDLIAEHEADGTTAPDIQRLSLVV